MARRHQAAGNKRHQHANGQIAIDGGFVQLLESRILLSVTPNLANVPYIPGMGYQLSGDTFYMPSSGATAPSNAAPVPPAGQRPFGAQYADGSEYMNGDVYVTVVLLQSDGTVDPQTETWTPTEIGNVKTRIAEGLSWWQTAYGNQGYTSPLNFTIDFTNADTPFKTSYEPIDRSSTDQYMWIDQFLATKGSYSGYNGVSQFNDDRRLATNSDWSYTVFVADSSADNDGMFTDGYFGYAYLGGPFVVMTYDNDGWGIDSMGQVFAHETGHIFYALDEYYVAGYGGQSYFDTSGYYNTQNTNAAYQRPGNVPPQVDSIMGDANMQTAAYQNHTTSPASMEMIGWRDTDSDKIIDVLDQPLTLTGTSGTWNWGGLQYSFSGTSTVQTLPNLNPGSHSTPGNDITLNEVDFLQYRLDGGPWINVNSKPYNTFSKTYTSQVINLPYVPQTLELRTCSADSGETSAIYPADITNHPPTDIALSNAALPQNQPVGTVIGTLSTTDSDVGDSATYSLVAGPGSGDNASFAISGGQLRSAVSLSYQPNKAYSVRIRSTDMGGLFIEKIFAIVVNDRPADIALSNASLPEIQPAGTVIGTISSTDPNIGDTSAYSLVPGPGGNDNARFAIVGTELRAAAPFDYESKNSYTLRIRTTDAGGLFLEKAFIVTITDLNEAPTGIALSSAIVPENQPASTIVGAFSSADPDAVNTFAYSLVPGSGSADNASFRISGNQLLTAGSFNFENKNGYMIRVQTTDQGGLSFEKAFAIGVKNVNEAPTDIGLTNNSVAEHSPAGAAAGTLLAIDPDARDTFTYTLVGGDGADDNGSFAIVGDTFVTTASFNYETKDSYSVRVRATDAGGLYYECAMPISVTNINEWPTNLTLSQSSIPEDQPAGTTVGTLTATDPDIGNTFTFSVAPRADGPDFARFTTVGDELRTTGSFDFDGKRAYSIRARVVDQNGLFYEKVFTINVTELPEFGLQQGKVKPVTITDADGDLVTFNLTGGGSGAVQPDNSVTLTDTTANTVLTITVKKVRGADGLFYLNGLTSDGLVKTVNAKAVVRSGPLHLNTLHRTGKDPVLNFSKIGGAGAQIQSMPGAASGVSAENSSAPAMLDSDVLLGVATNFAGRFAGRDDLLNMAAN